VPLHHDLLGVGVEDPAVQPGTSTSVLITEVMNRPLSHPNAAGQWNRRNGQSRPGTEFHPVGCVAPGEVAHFDDIQNVDDTGAGEVLAVLAGQLRIVGRADVTVRSVLSCSARFVQMSELVGCRERQFRGPCTQLS
jgi:hypothetical protein